jgi:group II intron reverse transcriptase/maturase
MRIRKAEKHMQTSMQEIAGKAKENPKHRFGNLYSLLNEQNLKACFFELNRKASPGVDGVDWQGYKAGLDKNVGELVEALREKRYKANLIRRRNIPKEGGRRPLGIPVIGDKVAQAVCGKILSAIYEADFLEYSHGYRRGKSPQRAALELSQRIHRGCYRWIVDADIKGFFNNLDHEWMIKMLEQRINDKSFLRLIKKWLKAGILEEDGKIIHPLTGTPQGGVVSAVLANVYLHYALDLWFEKIVKPRCKGQAMMIRYADDFVCCFQYQDEAQWFYKELEKRLSKFKLELSQEKTRLIKFTRFVTEKGERFTFLGFEYFWGSSRTGKPLVKMQTSKKKMRKALMNILDWLKQECNKLGTRAIMEKLKQKLQGHWNYYGVCGNIEKLSRFYHIIRKIMFKWLNRRSQRKSYNWETFSRILEYFRIPTPRIIAYWD